MAHGASSGSEKIKGKRKRNHCDAAQTLCRGCEERSGVRDREDSLADSAQCEESDGEDDDNDDVFLESWEEVAAVAAIQAATNGQCS